MNKIDVIKSFFNKGLKTRVSLGRKEDVFKECFNYILKNIEEVDNNEDFTKWEDYNKSLETVKFIKSKYLNEPIDKEFGQFSDAWVYLVYNWNDNTIKSPSIMKECIYTQRLIEDFITMKEVTENLKLINNKLNNFKSWNPPAFEVSKHFIDYLE